MNRTQLEHAIRAACDIAEDDELYVFGSQAILGQYPNAPDALRHSMDVDVVPKNRPERSNRIDGSIGEDSLFNQTHGFYVQGVSLETAVLPPGWKKRCVKVKNRNTNDYTGWCLEAHDLALAKLVAFRSKDKTFVRVLLREKLVKSTILLRRLPKVPIDAAKRGAIREWINATANELG